MTRTVVSSKGSLTPGEFCDRVVALRRELPALEAAALKKLRDAETEREARLLERVPEPERELAKAQLEAAARMLAPKPVIEIVNSAGEVIGRTDGMPGEEA